MHKWSSSVLVAMCELMWVMRFYCASVDPARWTTNKQQRALTELAIWAIWWYEFQVHRHSSSYRRLDGGNKTEKREKKCRCSNRFDEIIVVVSHVSSSLSIVFFSAVFHMFRFHSHMKYAVKNCHFFASSERKRQNRVMTTTDYGWGWGESAHFRGRSCLLHCQSIVCIDGYLSTFFPRIERSIIVHHVLLIRLYLSLVVFFRKFMTFNDNESKQEFASLVQIGYNAVGIVKTLRWWRRRSERADYDVDCNCCLASARATRHINRVESSFFTTRWSDDEKSSHLHLKWLSSSSSS